MPDKRSSTTLLICASLPTSLCRYACAPLRSPCARPRTRLPRARPPRTRLRPVAWRRRGGGDAALERDLATVMEHEPHGHERRRRRVDRRRHVLDRQRLRRARIDEPARAAPGAGVVLGDGGARSVRGASAGGHRQGVRRRGGEGDHDGEMLALGRRGGGGAARKWEAQRTRRRIAATPRWPLLSPRARRARR